MSIECALTEAGSWRLGSDFEIGDAGGIQPVKVWFG
jgi:hypothetical protein